MTKHRDEVISIRSDGFSRIGRFAYRWGWDRDGCNTSVYTPPIELWENKAGIASDAGMRTRLQVTFFQ
jgi:hypothetical protein